MSESYVINEKRELILDRVKEFIYQNGGVVKKSQLNELGIDYRRILDFVEKGDLIRIKNGYYAVRLSDFSEEELIARLFPDCVLNLETALYAYLSLIHISEPTRQAEISYAVFCLKKKKKAKKQK